MKSNTHHSNLTDSNNPERDHAGQTTSPWRRLYNVMEHKGMRGYSQLICVRKFRDYKGKKITTDFASTHWLAKGRHASVWKGKRSDRYAELL